MSEVGLDRAGRSMERKGKDAKDGKGIERDAMCWRDRVGLEWV